MEKGMMKKNNWISFIILVAIFAIAFSADVQAAKLNKTSLTLVKGKTYTLRLKGTKKKASWKAKNGKVAKLTNKKKSSVKIKAVKAGKTVIIAKAGSKTYKCKLTVVLPEKKPDSTAEEKPDETTETDGKNTTAKKKVWIITKWATNTYRPVYKNVRSQWECTCGHKTEDFDEAVKHQDNHILNEEPSAWRVNILRDYDHTEVIETPEEGYWIEINANEYPEGLCWRSDESAKARLMKDTTTGQVWRPTAGYLYIDKSGN